MIRVVALALAVSSSAACITLPDLGDEPVELEPGVKTAAELRWNRESYVSFVVEVPEDAMVLVLALADSEVDLDIFARHGKPMRSWEDDVEFSAATDLYNDTLRITRHESPALQAGTYYVDVTYNLDADPEVDGRPVDRIPFSIAASLLLTRVDAALAAGESLAARTEEESGWFRTFTVEVPDSADVLRIDLSGVNGDLDIAARHGAPVLDPLTADYLADSSLGRETLMVDRDGDPPLEPGTWYVDVFDPYGLDPVPFTVHVSFDALPAPALLALPRLPPPGEGIDRALRATVELLTSEGGGSGTLISPDGWVLTNHHVIELLGTEQPVAEGQVVIGFSFDERSPPVETFRGSVVVSDAELDLALVKIETGLYGQPLPAGFSFPYLELGDTDRVKIGDSVSLLGFPTLGGMGSRATVSLTRGVISGFDTALGGLMFKTDAEIGSGNSGGAALDAAWRLVGVPVAVREEVEGYSQLGYILPVSRMSPDWRALVGD